MNDDSSTPPPSRPDLPGLDPGAEGSPAAPPDPEEERSPEERELGGKMTFLEHLDELRKRILYSLISVLAAFVAAFTLREQIFSFLARPIADVLGGMDKLVFTKPVEPFTIWMKVSFVAGLFLASPFVLRQVWLFIAPGLYRKEKVYSIPFLLCSTLLFVSGGVFAYYVILPAALHFLIREFGAPFTPMVSAIEYFNFEILILVGMGLIFQMPVLVAFLSIFGLITPGFLWRNFRYSFLLILIIAAIASPTADVLNLFLWSGPMVILYMISIGISWAFQRRRQKRLEG